MLDSVRKICSLLTGFEKVYLYCVDPGAFNSMLPVYEALKENKKNAVWIFEGWCKNKGDTMEYMGWHSFKAEYEIIHDNKICLVLGSQVDPGPTQRAIEFCKEAGIFSVFLFDHWTNYSYHFLGATGLHLPDKICVMDEVARKSLMDELYTLLADKDYISNIEVVGHSAIERSVKLIQEMPEEKLNVIRNKIEAEGEKIILFLLEPIESDFGFDAERQPALGYTEYSILEYFFNNYSLDNAKVIIKPHPRQDAAKIKDFLSRSVSTKYDYVLVDNIDVESLIAVSDEVIGITTVALIIALKAGKKIKSIQVGRNEKGRKISNEYFESNLII